MNFLDTQTNSNNTVQIPNEIRTFIESILADAGMTNLGDEMHEQMINELFVRLDNFMLTTIIESLPADKLPEFTKMSEEGKSKAELEGYLKENIPNAEEVFARAMLEFRSIYLGDVAVARNTPTQTN